MSEAQAEGNEERKKRGWSELNLYGWAEKPHYDADAKKLYWAKELEFEGAPSNTLNYDVRVLGREGVLSMNAVASLLVAFKKIILVGLVAVGSFLAKMFGKKKDAAA
jgi:uncharacterized membrane-anchored protein